MTGVSQKLTYKLRNDIVQKINKLPIKNTIAIKIIFFI